MRSGSLLGVALGSLLLSASAAAAVRLVSISSPVRPGTYVTLSIRAGRAQCTPAARFRSRPPLHADGIAPKGTLFGGIVSWRWKMPLHAPRGRWTVIVSCGSSGTLHTSFIVR